LIDTNPVAKNSLRSYAYWLPPALAGLALTFVYLNPFIGDWDGLDYTVASLRGEPSSMALGRALFTLTNHTLYAIAHKFFGLPPEHAYLVFKFAVVAQMPLAIIACWVFTRHLTDSRESATVAALLVALSPMMVIYGGQVMTDVPSVFLTATALAIHVRGLQTKRTALIFAGAIVLGLAVNMRETAGLYFSWLVVAPFVAGWKFERRTGAVVLASLLLFALFALGIFALWYATHADYRATWHVWAESSQNEAARHPLKLANLKPFLVYLFLASPLIFIALPFAICREFRARRWSLLLLSALCGLCADAMLFFNYSTIINWRYFLTGLPALAPVAGDFFFRSQTEKLRSPRRGLVTAIAGVVVIAVAMGFLFQPRSNEYLNRLALAKDYKVTLDLLPRNAVVIAWRTNSGGHLLARHRHWTMGTHRYRRRFSGGQTATEDRRILARGSQSLSRHRSALVATVFLASGRDSRTRLNRAALSLQESRANCLRDSASRRCFSNRPTAPCQTLACESSGRS
jgi:hypothetical protein